MADIVPLAWQPRVSSPTHLDEGYTAWPTAPPPPPPPEDSGVRPIAGSVVGRPDDSFTQEQFNTLAQLFPALLRYTATARSWATRSVPAANGVAVLLSGADPRRISLSIQLPGTLAAWIGPSSSVSNLATSPTAGFPLPSGGAVVFGPENTLDVYLLHATAGVQDIRVLELFR